MIKVGIVGFGFMGQTHAQCYQMVPEAKVQAVVDVDPNKRGQAEKQFGCEGFGSVEEMLEDASIDVVDICSSTFLHEEQVVMAAQAGKHILCEKPMSIDVESCDRIIESVQRSGVTMMVGQVMRFWPEYAEVKRIVDSGEVGPVRWVSTQRLSPAPAWAWNNWISDQSKSGGIALDLLIHDVDFVSWLIGSPGKVLAQSMSSPSSPLGSIIAVGTEHNGGACSRMQGSFDMSPSFPFQMALTVVAERGTIRYDNHLQPSLMVYPADKEPYSPSISQSDIDEQDDTLGNISSLGAYLSEIRYFIDCVRNGKSPTIVTLDEARSAVKTCLNIRTAAGNGAGVFSLPV